MARHVSWTEEGFSRIPGPEAEQRGQGLAAQGAGADSAC